MEVKRISDFKGGWFVGNFEPSVFLTKDFEVCYVKHTRGEKWPVHYHKVAMEINYMIRGVMRICGKTVTQGDIFIIEPFEVADPVFLTDCEVMVIKTPSVKNDKYEVL